MRLVAIAIFFVSLFFGFSVSKASRDHCFNCQKPVFETGGFDGCPNLRVVGTSKEVSKTLRKFKNLVEKSQSPVGFSSLKSREKLSALVFGYQKLTESWEDGGPELVSPEQVLEKHRRPHLLSEARLFTALAEDSGLSITAALGVFKGEREKICDLKTTPSLFFFVEEEAGWWGMSLQEKDVLGFEAKPELGSLLTFRGNLLEVVSLETVGDRSPASETTIRGEKRDLLCHRDLRSFVSDFCGGSL